MKNSYIRAWEKLYDCLSPEEQELIINSPDGLASANLSVKALELSEKENEKYV